MFLARVQGQVVSTVKDGSLKGTKLLLVEPLRVNYAAGPRGKNKLEPTGRAIVAMDMIGAGVDQVVLITQGSSARMAEGCNKTPTDAVIVGIVDEANLGHEKLYQAGESQ